MSKTFIVRVHGDSFTEDFIKESEPVALEFAELCLQRGISMQMVKTGVTVFYPAYRIVQVEVIPS